MTKLSPEAKALVAAVSDAWVAHKVRRHAVEAELRARLASEIAEIERRSAFDVAEAIRRAISGGATQTSLREVTTKDFRTFSRFRDFDGLGTLP